MKLADRLLNRARDDSGDGENVGGAFVEDVLVTYYRHERQYEVGTLSSVLATGKRKDVLPALRELLGEDG